jgi:hypothetical protein
LVLKFSINEILIKFIIEYRRIWVILTEGKETKKGQSETDGEREIKNIKREREK